MKTRTVRQAQGFGNSDAGVFRIGTGKVGASSCSHNGATIRTASTTRITIATADERLRDDPLPAAEATSGVLSKFDDLA